MNEAAEFLEVLGPAMRALNERQRRFVLAYIEQGKDGKPNALRAALAAGYGGGGGVNEAALRVQGHRLVYNPLVQAAILELSKKEVNLAAAVIATPVTISIALNEKLSAKDRLRACEMLFNRGGMPALSEHKVTVEHVDDGRMLEFADRLAAELGVDRSKLVGANVVVPKLEDRTIEGGLIERAPDA